MQVSSQFTGMYNYKGFVIWDTGEREWIAEPSDWCDEASENLKYELPRHRTITKAKQWVREVGIHLKEEDYLK